MSNARCFGLSALLGVAFAAMPAYADDPANTATARALGIEGVTLADAGRCKEAVEKLERAEELHHAPTTATRLAECEIELGKLVAGTERLQRVVREPLAPNAHPAFAAAVARAQRSLERTLPRIPQIRVSVKAPPGTKIELTIDGERAPEAIVDANRPIDPGTHQILATADGFLASSAMVSIDEWQTKGVSLELRPDPNAAREAQEGDVRAAATDAAPPSKVPAFVAFGIGLVGIGVGAYAATEVSRKASDLSSSCDASHVCPSDRSAEIRSAKQWATVSTVGFIAGGIGVATGAVLLLLSGSSPPKERARVRPNIGLGSVGIDGVF